jgi:23S rRNA (cytidine1920-2'-O)/16S rRNA (cytidine1409-2'-O)-methyltransferase
MKVRLDQELTKRGLVASRSQAESYIRLGKVSVNGKVVTKPGHFVGDTAEVKLDQVEQYVSRAGMKLASVADIFGLDFSDKVVLDVGSSTGGFTDFALRRGACKVIAVDVGTDQLHPKLRSDKRVELHEKTDIRDFRQGRDCVSPDLVLIDVSFISLREILPYVAKYLSGPDTQIVAMAKPQFEAGKGQTINGVVKNDRQRREILKDFEIWAKKLFIIEQKADSEVAGTKGNLERLYSLTLVQPEP